MYRIPSTLDSDLDYTQSLIDKYEKGEIKASELKSNRVPMGIYEQRKNNHYMLRIRCAGGLITPEQLATVAFVGRKLSTSHLHITTRQEIQIHNVDLNDAVPALRKLEKVGLSSAGGGGNTVRNMMANDRSGLTDREAFDVYPYVIELTSRLIAEKDSFTMPRKYKVAFDYNVEDANYSYIADLGLQARVVDGERGFRVFIAGSAASKPHVGWEVFDFLPEKDLYRAAKALKNWFHKYGNRRNRHKARMRFVFYKLGEEEARRLYLEEFEELKKDPDIDFALPAGELEHHRPNFPPQQDESEGFLTWKKRYAHRQTTQQGLAENLWFACIAVNHGNNSTDFFAQVADYLGNFGNDVMRFTKKEQIQVRNIPEEYLPNIYNFFKRIGDYQIDYPCVVNNLTSCTGADTCRLGICQPKGAIDAIVKRLLNSGLDLDAIPDFKLKMNGCPNSCAVATWADLGFSGRVGRVGDDVYPAYVVWLPINGKHELSSQQGSIAAKYLPAFVENYLRDILNYLRDNLKCQADNFDYHRYVSERGAQTVKSLLEKYSDVPSYNENPDMYFDWDDDEKFSLIKYGQAECSAGLFDTIELDQKSIATNLKKIEQGTADDVEKTLHDIVFAENRMLLVTRGLDPRTDNDVYEGFVKEFINAGIVPEKFKVLTERARLGEPLLGYKSLIAELSDLLNDLYKNMDDSLQFKVGDKKPVKETAKEEPESEGASQGNEPTVKKDFRGVACPMNFVKTKIALSPMKSGEILEILLDDGQPIANVPGSVRNEGHTVLSSVKIGDYWKVTIKKK